MSYLVYLASALQILATLVIWNASVKIPAFKIGILWELHARKAVLFG
jgi:hypothetical protein